MRYQSIIASSLALLATAPASFAQETCSFYRDNNEVVEYTRLGETLGEVPKPREGLRFAYVPKSLLNDFFQDLAKGITEEGARFGVTVNVQAPKDEASLVDQLNLARTLLSQKPDVLLMSPQSDSNMQPVIEAAREMNIPTTIVDDARTEGATTYVGTDQVAIGEKAADYLHQLNPEGGDVAQIEGQAGSPNGRKRIEGFAKGLAKYPNLKLVASQPADWDRMLALNTASNILTQNPSLVGIYANNDTMALGASEAVRSAGRLDKVAVLGTDGAPEAKQSVADGGIRATVATFPYNEGVVAVQVALRVLGCQKVPSWVVSQSLMLDQSNVGQYMASEALPK